MRPVSDMTAIDADVEKAECCCLGGSCSSCPEPVEDPVHVSLLRIIGSITFVFGVIELGLGGTVYNFLRNVKLGGWWCGVPVVICGFFASFPKNKGWVTIACIFASFACVITAFGSVIDGANSILVQNLTACTSLDPASLKHIHHGDESDVPFAITCMNNAAVYVPDACYCVSKQGAYCGEYLLSKYATALNLKCSDILNNYAHALTASAAFCALSLIMAIALSFLTCVVLCCPTCKSPFSKSSKGKGRIKDMSVHGAPVSAREMHLRDG